MMSTPDTENDFDFYLRFAKPLVLNLNKPNDRALAAAWVQKLRDKTVGTEKLRTDYLKLLLFVLQRKKLIGVFSKNPNRFEKLEEFPETNLHNVAKELLEAEEQYRKQEIVCGVSGARGDSPPYSTEHSADLLEYSAAQDIPNFGVHAYYAISNEPLHNWDRTEKAVFPRAAGVVSTPEKSSTRLEHSSRIGNISSAGKIEQEYEVENLSTKSKSDDKKKEPKSKSKSSFSSPFKSRHKSCPDLVDQYEKMDLQSTILTVEASKTASAKRNGLYRDILSLSLGSKAFKQEGREPPTWGSNLINVTEPPVREITAELILSEEADPLTSQASMFGAESVPSDYIGTLYSSSPIIQGRSAPNTNLPFQHSPYTIGIPQAERDPPPIFLEAEMLSTSTSSKSSYREISPKRAGPALSGGKEYDLDELKQEFDFDFDNLDDLDDGNEGREGTSSKESGQDESDGFDKMISENEREEVSAPLSQPTQRQPGASTSQGLPPCCQQHLNPKSQQPTTTRPSQPVRTTGSRLPTTKASCCGGGAPMATQPRPGASQIARRGYQGPPAVTYRNVALRAMQMPALGGSRIPNYPRLPGTRAQGPYRPTSDTRIPVVPTSTISGTRIPGPSTSGSRIPAPLPYHRPTSGIPAPCRSTYGGRIPAPCGTTSGSRIPAPGGTKSGSRIPASGQTTHGGSRLPQRRPVPPSASLPYTSRPFPQGEADPFYLESPPSFLAQTSFSTYTSPVRPSQTSPAPVRSRSPQQRPILPSASYASPPFPQGEADPFFLESPPSFLAQTSLSSYTSPVRPGSASPAPVCSRSPQQRPISSAPYASPAFPQGEAEPFFLESPPSFLGQTSLSSYTSPVRPSPVSPARSRERSHQQAVIVRTVSPAGFAVSPKQPCQPCGTISASPDSLGLKPEDFDDAVFNLDEVDDINTSQVTVPSDMEYDLSQYKSNDSYIDRGLDELDRQIAALEAEHAEDIALYGSPPQTVCPKTCTQRPQKPSKTKTKPLSTIASSTPAAQDIVDAANMHRQQIRQQQIVHPSPPRAPEEEQSKIVSKTKTKITSVKPARGITTERNIQTTKQIEQETKPIEKSPATPADQSLDWFEECERECDVTTEPAITRQNVEEYDTKTALAAAHRQYQELLNEEAMADDEYQQRPADTSLDSFEECERACGITPVDRTGPTVSPHAVQLQAQAAQAVANKQYTELLRHAALAEEYERYKQRYQYRREGVPRTPPVFSRFAPLMGPESERVYQPAEFDLTEDVQWVPAEQHFEGKTQLSPRVCERRDDLKQLLPGIQRRAEAEQFFQTEVEPEYLAEIDKQMEELAAAEEAQRQTTSIRGGIPVTTPRKSPYPRRPARKAQMEEGHLYFESPPQEFYGSPCESPMSPESIQALPARTVTTARSTSPARTPPLRRSPSPDEHVNLHDIAEPIDLFGELPPPARQSRSPSREPEPPACLICRLYEAGEPVYERPQPSTEEGVCEHLTAMQRPLRLVTPRRIKVAKPRMETLRESPIRVPQFTYPHHTTGQQRTAEELQQQYQELQTLPLPEDLLGTAIPAGWQESPCGKCDLDTSIPEDLPSPMKLPTAVSGWVTPPRLRTPALSPCAKLPGPAEQFILPPGLRADIAEEIPPTGLMYSPPPLSPGDRHPGLQFSPKTSRILTRSPPRVQSPCSPLYQAGITLDQEDEPLYYSPVPTSPPRSPESPAESPMSLFTRLYTEPEPPYLSQDPIYIYAGRTRSRKKRVKKRVGLPSLYSLREIPEAHHEEHLPFLSQIEAARPFPERSRRMHVAVPLMQTVEESPVSIQHHTTGQQRTPQKLQQEYQELPTVPIPEDLLGIAAPAGWQGSPCGKCDLDTSLPENLPSPMKTQTAVLGWVTPPRLHTPALPLRAKLPGPAEQFILPPGPRADISEEIPPTGLMYSPPPLSPGDRHPGLQFSPKTARILTRSPPRVQSPCSPLYQAGATLDEEDEPLYYSPVPTTPPLSPESPAESPMSLFTRLYTGPEPPYLSQDPMYIYAGRTRSRKKRVKKRVGLPSLYSLREIPEAYHEEHLPFLSQVEAARSFPERSRRMHVAVPLMQTLEESPMSNQHHTTCQQRTAEELQYQELPTVPLPEDLLGTAAPADWQESPCGKCDLDTSIPEDLPSPMKLPTAVSGWVTPPRLRIPTLSPCAKLPGPAEQFILPPGPRADIAEEMPPTGLMYSPPPLSPGDRHPDLQFSPKTARIITRSPPRVQSPCSPLYQAGTTLDEEDEPLYYSPIPASPPPNPESPAESPMSLFTRLYTEPEPPYLSQDPIYIYAGRTRSRKKRVKKRVGLPSLYSLREIPEAHHEEHLPFLSQVEAARPFLERSRRMHVAVPSMQTLEESPVSKKIKMKTSRRKVGVDKSDPNNPVVTEVVETEETIEDAEPPVSASIRNILQNLDRRYAALPELPQAPVPEDFMGVAGPLYYHTQMSPGILDRTLPEGLPSPIRPPTSVPGWTTPPRFQGPVAPPPQYDYELRRNLRDILFHEMPPDELNFSPISLPTSSPCGPCPAGTFLSQQPQQLTPEIPSSSEKQESSPQTPIQDVFQKEPQFLVVEMPPENFMPPGSPPSPESMAKRAHFTEAPMSPDTTVDSFEQHENSAEESPTANVPVSTLPKAEVSPSSQLRETRQKIEQQYQSLAQESLCAKSPQGAPCAVPYAELYQSPDRSLDEFEALERAICQGTPIRTNANAPCRAVFDQMMGAASKAQQQYAEIQKSPTWLERVEQKNRDVPDPYLPMERTIRTPEYGVAVPQWSPKLPNVPQYAEQIDEEFVPEKVWGYTSPKTPTASPQSHQSCMATCGSRQPNIFDVEPAPNEFLDSVRQPNFPDDKIPTPPRIDEYYTVHTPPSPQRNVPTTEVIQEVVEEIIEDVHPEVGESGLSFLTPSTQQRPAVPPARPFAYVPGPRYRNETMFPESHKADIFEEAGEYNAFDVTPPLGWGLSPPQLSLERSPYLGFTPPDTSLSEEPCSPCPGYDFTQSVKEHEYTVDRGTRSMPRQRLFHSTPLERIQENYFEIPDNPRIGYYKRGRPVAREHTRVASPPRQQGSPDYQLPKPIYYGSPGREYTHTPIGPGRRQQSPHADNVEHKTVTIAEDREPWDDGSPCNVCTSTRLPFAEQTSPVLLDTSLIPSDLDTSYIEEDKADFKWMG